jgi:hypothetical protein
VSALQLATVSGYCSKLQLHTEAAALELPHNRQPSFSVYYMFPEKGRTMPTLCGVTAHASSSFPPFLKGHFL